MEISLGLPFNTHPAEDFYEAHRSDIALCQAAKNYFNDNGYGKNKRLPAIADLKKEYAILEAEKKKLDGVSILAEVRLRSPFFPEDVGWYINGRAVTEDEYNAMLNSILLGGCDNVERIWPYALTEANIQDVIFH